MKNKLSLILLLILVSGICTPVKAQTEEEYPVYIIQPGDSLGFIASRFNTTIAELIELNNIPNLDLISPGDRLFIPGMSGIKGILTPVTAKLGDTYENLAKKYQFDKKSLIQINKLISFSEIYTGTELLIPIPEMQTAYVPIGKLDSYSSVLEISSIMDLNPVTLSIINLQNSENIFLPDTLIYTELSNNVKQINPFSPLIQELTLSPLPLVQGSTQVIHVNSIQPVELQGSLDGVELVFFSENSIDYYALQGIYALTEPGLTEFNLTGTFSNGEAFKLQQSVLVQAGNFDTDPPLMVDPELINPKITEPENELIYNLISQINPERYWKDQFQSPAVYDYYNSLFGTRRTYNDDPKLTFHTGVDFGGGVTLPIFSPSEGRVVFAGPLTVRGNTTFIDHGWGVFSGFFHQNSIKVKVGDFVEKGQTIGEVGNTGRVNGADDYPGAGAHLHWEVWVNEYQVDPLSWLENQYP